MASLMVPPTLIIAYLLYRSKRMNDCTRHEHWSVKRIPSSR